jgi:hypothetical protein
MAQKEYREKWTAIIETARSHPDGVTAYLKRNGITHASYYHAFKKLKPLHPDWEERIPRWRKVSAARAEFVPVTVVAPAPRLPESLQQIEIVLTGGARVLLPAQYGAQQLAQLLRALEVRC